VPARLGYLSKERNLPTEIIFDIAITLTNLLSGDASDDCKGSDIFCDDSPGGHYRPDANGDSWQDHRAHA
jgi:hypothetical protein